MKRPVAVNGIPVVEIGGVHQVTLPVGTETVVIKYDDESEEEFEVVK